MNATAAPEHRTVLDKFVLGVWLPGYLQGSDNVVRSQQSMSALLSTLTFHNREACTRYATHHRGLRMLHTRHGPGPGARDRLCTVRWS